MSRSEQPTPQSSGKKRDLLSLLGLLHHTASVVRPGRAFLCSLIHAAVAVKSLITGSTSTAQREQTWLGGTHSSVCGVEPALCLRQDPPLQLVSDASGAWGCGAFHGNCWFQLQWPESWAAVSIVPKELVPIVVAATLWGPQWAGRHVQCLCDNATVVRAVNKGAARDPTLSHLLRILAFLAAI